MIALLVFFGAVMYGLGWGMGWMMADDKRRAAEDSAWWAAFEARETQR